MKSYQRDISKHAPSDIVPRITDIWNSIPAQLSKENRKFIYGLVREGARAREYEIALQWLQDAVSMNDYKEEVWLTNLPLYAVNSL